MATDNLKPCPCCSGNANLYKVDYHGYRVVCMRCGLQTSTYEFPENAVARWNRRANE